MIPIFCRQNDLFLSLPARTIDKTGLNMFQFEKANLNNINKN